MEKTFETLTLQRFISPLRFRFRHATREHRSCEAIIVTIGMNAGTTGHGEIQVRPYLSGETLDGAEAFIIERLWPALKGQNITDVTTLWATLGKLHALADASKFPAAYAGLELAVVSAFCSANQLPIKDVVATLFRSSNVPAQMRRAGPSIVMSPLPMMHRWGQKLFAFLFAVAGVKAVKVKIGRGDIGNLVNLLGPFSRRFPCLGLDANGAPRADAWLKAAHPGVKIAFIEQPTERSEENQWQAIASLTGGVMIADESICTVDDAMRLRDNPGCGGWNLRYAKNGGFMGILRILALAPNRPFRVHLGSLVGETFILKKTFQALTHELHFDLIEPSRTQLLLQRQPVTTR